MKTKFTVSMVVTVEHPEGTKVTKKNVRESVESALTECGLLDAYGNFDSTKRKITKVTIRSIDFD